MQNWLTRHWFQLVAIALLLGALLSFPFAYYQIMNWVVAIAAIQVAYRAYWAGMEPLTWLFGAVAVVFNPLAPLYFRADVWQIADIVAAVLFALSFVLERVKLANR